MTKSIVKVNNFTDLEQGNEIIESRIALGKNAYRIKIAGIAASSVVFSTATIASGFATGFFGLLAIPLAGMLGAYGFAVAQRFTSTSNLPTRMEQRAFDSGMNHEQAKIVRRETVSALKLYRWVPGGTLTIKHKSNDMSKKNAVRFQILLKDHEVELNVVKDPLTDFDNAFISALEMSGKSFNALSDIALSEIFNEKRTRLHEKKSPDYVYDNLYRQELTAIINKDCSIGYASYVELDDMDDY